MIRSSKDIPAIRVDIGGFRGRSWMTQVFPSLSRNGATSLVTLCDSPVSWDCSILMVVVFSCITSTAQWDFRDIIYIYIYR